MPVINYVIADKVVDDINTFHLIPRSPIEMLQFNRYNHYKITVFWDERESFKYESVSGYLHGIISAF